MNLAQDSTDQVLACQVDPDRWIDHVDDSAKALCRACPLRWQCAREACETPGAEGLWAGIVIPPGGRGRTFALRQLRSLAERGGYPVRGRRRYPVWPVDEQDTGE
ncbi:WhiB family transcriptional regulator (plasmid) [Mycolicibacterium aichiense]|uniref:WhiB family transcriptional regulator n=1 Tax=Mycolicibacterium aichiense TaxID=1799 RepID=UPI003D67DEBA